MLSFPPDVAAFGSGFLEWMVKAFLTEDSVDGHVAYGDALYS